MKIPLKLSILALSAAAGYAGVWVGLNLFPNVKPGSTAAGAAAGSGPPGEVRGGNDSIAKIAAERPGETAGGAALAAQFRVLLVQLGMDASWAEGLAAADSSGFPAMLEKMKALPDGPSKQLRELLMGRWAALDPAGGAEFLKSKKDEDGLSELFRQWQRLDFPAAAAKAGEYGDTILRRTLRDKAMLDPAGLITWLAGRPDLNPLSVFSSGGYENQQALARLAETDPDKMLAWTRQVPEEKWDNSFLVSLGAQLAKRGPDEAIAWAKSIRDSGRSASALAGVAGSLAPTAPERALALLGEMPVVGDFEMSRFKVRVISKLDLKDPDKARALAESLPKGEIRSQILQDSLSKLLTSDPAKAFSTADSLGLEAEANWFYDLSPAMKNPDGERQILEAAGAAGKESIFRTNVARQALLGWLEQDPGSLAAYLKGKTDSPLMGSLKQSLQTGLALQQLRDGQADPDLVALVGLPAEELLTTQASINPGKAAAALESVTDPEARARTAKSIAQSFIRDDRVGAVSWAETIRDPEAQGAALKVITESWVKEDSWQASEWIAKLPAGQGRDNAVLAMAEGIQKTDPDLAWKWALSMSDPALKNQALASAAQSWATRDAPALQQALNDGTLSAAEQQAVLEKLKTGPGQ